MKAGGRSIASTEYRAATAEVQRACRRDRKQHLLEKCASIEAQHQAGNSKAMYTDIKQLVRKFEPRLNVIKSKDGEVLTETADILGRWREYCSKLYSDDLIEDRQELECELTELTKDSDLTPLQSEVEQAMKTLKQGKAPRCNGIPSELLLAGGNAAVTLMHKLCVKIWQTANWPIDWCRALFVPLPKKGDLQL